MNPFIIIGVLLCLAEMLTNRFVRPLPNWLAIAVCFLGLVFLAAGMFYSSNR